MIQSKVCVSIFTFRFFEHIRQHKAKGLFFEKMPLAHTFLSDVFKYQVCTDFKSIILQKIIHRKYLAKISFAYLIVSLLTQTYGFLKYYSSSITFFPYHLIFRERKHQPPYTFSKQQRKFQQILDSISTLPFGKKTNKLVSGLYELLEQLFVL